MVRLVEFFGQFIRHFSVRSLHQGGVGTHAVCEAQPLRLRPDAGQAARHVSALGKQVAASAFGVPFLVSSFCTCVFRGFLSRIPSSRCRRENRFFLAVSLSVVTFSLFSFVDSFERSCSKARPLSNSRENSSDSTPGVRARSSAIWTNLEQLKLRNEPF